MPTGGSINRDRSATAGGDFLAGIEGDAGGRHALDRSAAQPTTTPRCAVSTLFSPLAFGREERRTLACHDLSRPGGQGQAMPVGSKAYTNQKMKAATQIGLYVGSGSMLLKKGS